MLPPTWGNSRSSSIFPKVLQSSEIPQDSSGFLQAARAGLGQQDWSGLLTFLLQGKFKSKVSIRLGPSAPEQQALCTSVPAGSVSQGSGKWGGSPGASATWYPVAEVPPIAAYP